MKAWTKEAQSWTPAVVEAKAILWAIQFAKLELFHKV